MPRAAQGSRDGEWGEGGWSNPLQDPTARAGSGSWARGPCAALEQAPDAVDEARIQFLFRGLHLVAPDDLRPGLDFPRALDPRLDAAHGHDATHRLGQKAVHLA